MGDDVAVPPCFFPIESESARTEGTSSAGPVMVEMTNVGIGSRVQTNWRFLDEHFRKKGWPTDPDPWIRKILHGLTLTLEKYGTLQSRSLLTWYHTTAMVVMLQDVVDALKASS